MFDDCDADLGSVAIQMWLNQTSLLRLCMVERKEIIGTDFERKVNWYS